MARNWLRHHVQAQDGQAIIRKIVVSPAESAAVLNDMPSNNAGVSPQQARDIVERARKLRETRERRTLAQQRMR